LLSAISDIILSGSSWLVKNSEVMNFGHCY
jgi:hypothetical protein